MSDRRRRDKREKKRRRSSSSSEEDRSRRKRRGGGGGGRSGWDMAPAGGAMLSGLSPDPTAPTSGVLQIAGPAGAGALVTLPAAGAGAVPAAPTDPNGRRLYIGNVPAQLSDEMVQNYFKMHAIALRHRLYKKRVKEAEEAGQDSNIIPVPSATDDPVDKCNITRSPDPTRAGFAFVELNDEELTTDCLCLDSKPCPLPDGTFIQLKVSRPKNYVPPAAPPVPAWLRKNADSLSLPGHAKGNVVMTGLPDSMPDEEIRELLETFGELKNYQLLAEADGASMACCTFDFEDEQDDDKAINALNGVDIGSDVLNVRKVGAGALVLHTGNGDDAENMSNEEHDKLILKTIVNVSKGLHEVLQLLAHDPRRPLAAQKGPVKKPTKVLALLNMFDAEDLENTESFELIKADIEREAEKYGRVVTLTIPRDYPAPPEKPEQPAEPTLLLEPQTGPVKNVLSITAAPEAVAAHPHGPPPGYALDLNRNALVPLAKLQDETARIETENKDRMKKWEEECRAAEEGYKKSKRVWDKEMQDPIKNGVGKVFIEYWTADEALKAQVALAGRHFDGRTVVTSFVPEEWMYEKKETEEEDQSFEQILAALMIEDMPAEGDAADTTTPAPEAAADSTPAEGADAAAAAASTEAPTEPAEVHPDPE